MQRLVVSLITILVFFVGFHLFPQTSTGNCHKGTNE
jgi:hypothetical protein